MDIFKMSKNHVVKISRFFLPSAVLNEIFLTDLSLKYDLANAQKHRIFSNFQTEYFRRFCH